jgi:hypothetical protein
MCNLLLLVKFPNHIGHPGQTTKDHTWVLHEEPACIFLESVTLAEGKKCKMYNTVNLQNLKVRKLSIKNPSPSGIIS